MWMPVKVGTSKVWDSKFTIDYTKRQTKGKRKQQAEFQLKKLENNFEISNNLREYESLKNNSELIYDRIAEGIRISKYDWNEEGEKSIKVFLNNEVIKTESEKLLLMKKK